MVATPPQTHTPDPDPHVFHGKLVPCFSLTNSFPPESSSNHMEELEEEESSNSAAPAAGGERLLTSPSTGAPAAAATAGDDASTSVTGMRRVDPTRVLAMVPLCHTCMFSSRDFVFRVSCSVLHANIYYKQHCCVLLMFGSVSRHAIP